MEPPAKRAKTMLGKLSQGASSEWRMTPIPKGNEAAKGKSKATIKGLGKGTEKGVKPTPEKVFGKLEKGAGKGINRPSADKSATGDKSEGKGATEKGSGKGSTEKSSSTLKYPAAAGKANLMSKGFASAVPKSGSAISPPKSSVPMAKIPQQNLFSAGAAKGQVSESKAAAKAVTDRPGKASVTLTKVKGAAGKGSTKGAGEIESVAPKGSAKGEGKGSKGLNNSARPGVAARTSQTSTTPGSTTPGATKPGSAPGAPRPIGGGPAMQRTFASAGPKKVVRACKCGSTRAEEYWRALESEETYCSPCWEKIQVRTPKLGLVLGLEAMRDIGVALPIEV